MTTNKTENMNNKETSNISTMIWQFADTLAADGIAYTEYLVQITYLLFLKLDADNPIVGMESLIPEEYSWQALHDDNGQPLEGERLLDKYEFILKKLSEQGNIVGTIFTKAENKITKPVYLKQIIEKLDALDILSLQSTDYKGQIYEEMLQKNGNEKKSAAGQYFTPRALIEAIVDCVNPTIDDTVCDPACGTGGFLISAYYHMKNTNIKDARKLEALQTNKIFGYDNTSLVVTMATMNMYLHGIGGNKSPILLRDSLEKEPDQLFDVILANPPFGARPSAAIAINRPDFYVTTSNNQVNFLQHIMLMLKNGGKAGVVLPDNVLFEGGATAVVRKKLLTEFNLHTILRLPCGIFYAQGVKANVLFFTKGEPTKDIYIYDYRTDIKHSLATKPLQRADLDDFVKCFNLRNILDRKETYHEITNPNGRFRKYTIDEIATKRRDYDLNISWISNEENIEDVSLEKLIESLNEKSQIIVDAVANIKKVLQND